MLGIIAYAGYRYTPELFNFEKGAILEGDITITPVNPSANDSEKIPAGSTVTKATITNMGTQPSAPGEAVIRFAFLKPMDTHAKSVIYETETVPLPWLKPKEHIELLFKTPHQWPSLTDFIKNDWAMRQYQVVVNADKKNEVVIGTRAISYTAYYYPGLSHKMPTPVPAAQPTPK